MDMQDHHSEGGLQAYLNSLTPDERTLLLELLAQPKTYLAEDMTDVLAILNELDG